jgi:O-methyltransferase involved in polyketide biosynthesis
MGECFGVRLWTAELVAAGLDPSLPTAWLAEGLLYCLEPSCVGAMLQVSVLELGARLVDTMQPRCYQYAVCWGLVGA